MLFKDYIAVTGKSLSEVGKELGVSAPAVFRWQAGQSIPKPALMRKIMTWSKGNVMPNDFYQPDTKVAP